MVNHVTFEEFGSGIEGNFTKENELEILVPTTFFIEQMSYGAITFRILFEEALLDAKDLCCSGFTYEPSITKIEDDNIKKVAYQKTFEPEPPYGIKKAILTVHMLKRPNGSILVSAENKAGEKSCKKIDLDELRNRYP
jgi:hypothetical protein